MLISLRSEGCEFLVVQYIYIYIKYPTVEAFIFVGMKFCGINFIKKYFSWHINLLISSKTMIVLNIYGFYNG